MRAGAFAIVFMAGCLCCYAEDGDSDVKPKDTTPAAATDEKTLSDEDQRLADEEKSARLAILVDDVKRAEAAVKDATKTRDRQKLADAKQSLVSARQLLNESKRRPLQDWLDIRNARVNQERERVEAAKEDRDKRPLFIRGAMLRMNVINIPDLVVKVENKTDIAINAYSIKAECFNRFDERVNGISGSNVFGGLSQDTLRPGGSELGSWQLSLHRNTAYAHVWIARIKFADGTEWTQTKDEAMARNNLVRAKLPQ